MTEVKAAEDNLESAAPLLELRKVSLSFPGVLALDEVDFDLRPGETHILFGENGAGKSTLCSVISGVNRPDQGTVFLKNKPVRVESVHHARELGISAVFQEFSLVGQLTVEQNLFLGAEPVSGLFLDKREIKKKAGSLMEELGFKIKLNRRVESLSRAEQQMVEIAKAFRSQPVVLILDEPTASLTDNEAEHLFALMDRVKREGVGLIYITHRMGEIKKLGDRITVLRDGKKVATVTAATGEQELIRLMTGRVYDQIYPVYVPKPENVILEVSDLTLKNRRARGVSFNVRRGEIVGFAGLVGSGKSESVRACFGIDKPETGKVIFDGEDVTGYSVKKMLVRGFYYNPSDRRKEGLVMDLSCRENMILPALEKKEFSRAGFVRSGKEKDFAQGLSDKFMLRPPDIERSVQKFSGGNQQKVLLAKCLTREIKLFVFDEPTVGVDVGTRVEIYKFIVGLCEKGAAVILISSDLAEVIHLSSRLYVMHGGRIQAELAREEITEENVLSHFFEKNTEAA